MANIDRRTFLRATTAVAAGGIAPDLAQATDNNNKELMASPPTTTAESGTRCTRIIMTGVGTLPERLAFSAPQPAPASSWELGSPDDG